MRLTLIGIAIGGAAAFMSSRVLRGMLYGVGPGDTLTYVGVSLLLAAVALAACALPAWRSSREPPMVALRSD